MAEKNNGLISKLDRRGKTVFYVMLGAILVFGASFIIGLAVRGGLFEQDVPPELEEGKLYTGYASFIIIDGIGELDNRTIIQVNGTIDLYSFETGQLIATNLTQNSSIHITEISVAMVNYSSAVNEYTYHNASFLVEASKTQENPLQNQIVVARRTHPSDILFNFIKINDSSYGDYDEADLSPNINYTIKVEFTDNGFIKNQSTFISYVWRPNGTLHGYALDNFINYEYVWLAFNEEIINFGYITAPEEFQEEIIHSISGLYVVPFHLPKYCNCNEVIRTISFETTGTVPTEIFIYSGDIMNFDERVDL